MVMSGNTFVVLGDPWKDWNAAPDTAVLVTAVDNAIGAQPVQTKVKITLMAVVAWVLVQESV